MRTRNKLIERLLRHLFFRNSSDADDVLASWRKRKEERFQQLSRVEQIRELYRETPIVVGGPESDKEEYNWTQAIATKTNPANLHEGYNLAHFLTNNCPIHRDQKKILYELLDYVCKDLNQGCDKPSTGPRGGGVTPIFNAAMLGMGKDEGRMCAEYLIDLYGAELTLHVQDHAKFTPVMYAAHANNVKTVEYFLKSGACIADLYRLIENGAGEVSKKIQEFVNQFSLDRYALHFSEYREVVKEEFLGLGFVLICPVCDFSKVEIQSRVQTTSSKV